ncbi:hypothetical protein B0A54_03172 [Friedmanniomyces endolithicus]|uniref:Uncharacterized protein n=1 Tax=Friedmanniomyces endolithicus TaxID=329885 RepID=A0A4U0V8W6_9PEZI|nr:hypothetical protein B0A54_03172 [Friedmanniomyces endolithicus]
MDDDEELLLLPALEGDNTPTALLLVASIETELVNTGSVLMDVLDEEELDVVPEDAALELTATGVTDAVEAEMLDVDRLGVDKLDAGRLDVARLDDGMLDIAELMLDVATGLVRLMLVAGEDDGREDKPVILVLIVP